MLMDRTTEQLARQIWYGVMLPLRICLRPCSALLDGDGTVSAATIQLASNAAVLGASGGLAVDVEPA
jgi:hypothetical protein